MSKDLKELEGKIGYKFDDFTGDNRPCMIFASLQYVTNAPFRTADDPSVSVISEAICPDVADSIVVIVRFFSIRSFVSFL